jgi:hypothetical protein
MNLVISQSMFFPWVGLLEQVSLADIYVYYDDVPFSKGSFTNRVQLKTENGPAWLTVPLSGLKSGQNIDSVAIPEKAKWMPRHLGLLKTSLGKCSYYNDALSLYHEVVDRNHPTIGSLARHSLMVMCDYFGLTPETKFVTSTELQVPGNSTDRVLEIAKKLKATTYITGHGARNYLEHELFDQNQIEVRYMDYRCCPYPQRHGDFTPYVSGLDLVASCGQAGREVISPQTVHWKEFVEVSRVRG